MTKYLARIAVLLFAIAVFCVPTRAQTLLRWTYAAGYSTTGTSAKLTLQNPSGGTRVLHPLTLSIVVDGACTITLTRNGTVATATAGTVVKNRTAIPSAQTQFYSASNSTGGTAYPGYPLLAAGSVVLDLSDMEFIAAERLTVAVACGSSQAITLAAKFEEY